MPNSEKPRHLKLISNEDLKNLIQSREGTGFVTMLSPLELFMARDVLEGLVRASLDALRSERKPNESPDQKIGVERAIQQRVDFLSWLQVQPDQLYMAMYPADMDGLDDLEDLLEEFAEGEGPDLPF
jgi:hypothetical protein